MSLFSFRQSLRGDLRIKIFLSISAAMLLVALIVGTAGVYFQQRDHRNHLITNGKAIASLLAAGVRIGVISENDDYITGPVQRVLGQPFVERVLIASTEDRVLYDYSNTMTDTLPAALPHVGASRPRQDFYETRDSYFFINPITDRVESFSEEALYFETEHETREKIIAYLWVQVTKDILWSEQQAILLKTFLGFGCFLLLSFLLTYFITGSIMAPLRRLLSQIDRTAPAPDRRDDLNVLSDTYDRLIENLERSFAVNDELRQNLSDQVKVRTSELQSANQALEQTIMDLKESQMQLVQAEKMATLGQIAAGIAHEVNNATNFINGSLELLLSTVRQLEKEHGLDISQKMSYPLDKLSQNMRVGIQRISGIVRDLSTFSRPPDAEMTLADINHELDFTLRFIEHEYMDRIVIRRDYGVLKPVRCHARTINQAFLNIILNAIHSIAGDGGITITTSLKDGKILVRIQDTGCGIEPAIMGRIFDPFFTTKPSGKGTGLGLGIVYSIIREHQGNVTIQSAVGKGTTVEIVLPAVG